MRIAVLDDDPKDSGLLEGYLARYQAEHGTEFEVSVYHAGLDLLEEYDRGFDVVFLDIEMPGMDGMEVARQIRRTDEAVGLIFITNMAQYALRGYEVNAVDFMVKPVGYFNFASKLERALRFVRRRMERVLALTNEEGLCRVPVSEVYAVEKNGNYVCYHTGRGEFTQRDTIRAVREVLEPLSFAECTSGCLVNLRHVERIGRDTVLVGTATYPLSRRNRKQFTEDYMKFLGGTL